MEHTITSTGERKILINSLIAWIAVPSIALVAYFIYFIFYADNPDYLVFMMLVGMLIVIYGRWTFRLYQDISLNYVVEGKATVSYSGITFLKDRYINLNKFDSKRITLQRNAWYNIKIGTVIKYRIAIQSGLLLSYEIV